ncbi:MAG: hypothetical protein IJ191_02550 [Treponema sp.]|nr:hypothetical protein [Treponema sp.]
MKNVLVLLTAFLLICVGCTHFFPHDFEIKNGLSVDVTFSVKNYGATQYHLATDEAITLELYTYPNFIFTGIPRVYYTSGGGSATIKDISSIVCTIHNKQSNDVYISEKNDLLGRKGDVPAEQYDADKAAYKISANGELTIKLYMPYSEASPYFKPPAFVALDANDRQCSITVSEKWDSVIIN